MMQWHTPRVNLDRVELHFRMRGRGRSATSDSQLASCPNPGILLEENPIISQLLRGETNFNQPQEWIMPRGKFSVIENLESRTLMSAATLSQDEANLAAAVSQYDADKASSITVLAA